MNSHVDGANGTLDPKEPQHRHGAREQRPQPAREEQHRQEDGRDHEGAFDPEVGADVVTSDRECEADGRERQRRRAAKRALEQHGGRDGPAVPRVAARGLVDPNGVAPDGGRQHLPTGVGDEVRTDEPTEPVVDRLRCQEPLPAPGHRPDRQHDDRDRSCEVAEVRVHEHVHGLAEIDLPDDVRGAETRDDERPGQPDQAPLHRISVTTGSARTPRGSSTRRRGEAQQRQSAPTVARPAPRSRPLDETARSRA